MGGITLLQLKGKIRGTNALGMLSFEGVEFICIKVTRSVCEVRVEALQDEKYGLLWSMVICFASSAAWIPASAVMSAMEKREDV